MPILKGLEGLAGTISIGGSSRDFVDIGNAEVALSMTSKGYKNAVLVDPIEPDGITIVEQPLIGRAIPRKTGKAITVDFLDYDPDVDTDVEFVYDRVKDGVTNRVRATITVEPAVMKNGWDKGDFYNLEFDPVTKRTIVEPSRDTRRIHISPSGTGLSAQDIANLEPSIADNEPWRITGTWLWENLANGSSYHYGETEALAIDEDLAVSMWSSIHPTNNQYSPWLLFEKDGTYNERFFMQATRGFSALHPVFLSVWGVGADPVFTEDDAVWAIANEATRNIVVQDLTKFKITSNDGAGNLIVDGFEHDGRKYAFEVAGNARKQRVTFRRFKILNSHFDTPQTVGDDYWSYGYNDRAGNTYLAGTNHALQEYGLFHHGGWEEGYRADGLYDDGMGNFYGQIPHSGSHNSYQQTDNQGMYMYKIVTSYAAFNGVQARGGCHAQDIISLANNVHFLVGSSSPSLIGDGFAKGNAVNYSYVDRVVCYSAGLKAYWIRQDDAPVGAHYKAVGFDIQNPEAYLTRCVVADDDLDRTDHVPMVDGTTIGPCYDYDTNNPTLSSAVRVEFSVYGLEFGPEAEPPADQRDIQILNWSNASPDWRVDGISQAVLDGTTAGDYNDYKTGSSGSEVRDLANRLVGLENPWDEVEEIANWTRARLGNSDTTVRTVAQTVTFAPLLNGKSPGNQAYTNLDWDTGDRPGTVDGDSVDLDGHSIAWNITPENSIDDFTFGAGAETYVCAGILEPTGDFIVGDDGNRVRIGNGAKMYINGVSGTGAFPADVQDGRWMNKTTITGGISLKARYRSEVVLAWNSGSFTLGDGETLIVYGGSKVGFDGTGGGTTSLVLHSGSTLAFKPTYKMFGETILGGFNIPKIGYPIIGDTSGATGVCREFQYRINYDWAAFLDDLEGVFQLSETFSGVTERGPDPHRGFTDTYGSVRVAPFHTYGAITEFETGINGYDGDDLVATDVNSTVTLGGTLHLDVTGLGNNIYTLIDVDTVLGVFGAVTAAGNSAKDLTISITGTTVTVLVEDGNGTVTGGTS